MGQYIFSYEMPSDFTNRVIQVLQQSVGDGGLARAFQQCKYEYEDIGNAYYAGIKGDNWNKHALDFTFEGGKDNITLLRNKEAVLKDAMTKGLRPSVSGFLIRNILFLINQESVLPATDEERFQMDISSANAVLADLIQIGEKLSTNVLYKKETPENNLNDCVRDALSFKGYSEVKDQTRHGLSQTGKDAGEVDLLVTKDGKEIAIIEGLKLSIVDSTYIDNHIHKAIINYNALGTATFIVAYITTGDYGAFWNRYSEYLKNYKYPLKIKREFEIKTSPNAAVRIANMVLSRDEYDFPVYFLTIKIN